ncbi:siderophore ABC transporter substrate-binding protein [Rhodobacteraceae bacterium NNCM2]|nr:siderophore ABC transporter substrate-binding protein [Coraliihabitans acroporae]
MKKILLMTAALMAGLALPAQAEDLTVTHSRGETTVARNPETVVVFDLASLDNLDALGVEVDAVPGGVKPSYLLSYNGDGFEKVGTLFEPDYEAVAALEPDLIVVGGRSSAKYDDLAAIAPTIDLTVDRENFLSSVHSNVGTLARIFDKEAEAAEQLAALDASIAELNAKAKGAGTGLLVLTTGGRMGTHGPDGRFSVLFHDFGVQPAVAEIDPGNHGQAISHEFILEANPDWLYVIDRDVAIGREGTPAKQLLDNPIVARTTAWSKGQVVYLDPANWYLIGGGLTALQANVDQISAALDGK